jgi:hypothetical protein
LWRTGRKTSALRPAALGDRPVMREAALLSKTSEIEDAAPHVQ